MFWVEVLNAALEWQDRSDAQAFQERLASRAALTPTAHAALLQDVATLRSAFACGYLGVAPERQHHERLLQWLATVTLTAETRQVGGNFTWPQLRARRAGDVPEPFDALLSTSIVQMTSQRWDAEGPNKHCHRCHGILRRDDATAPPAWLHADAFAARAGIAMLVGRDEFVQCPRLIASSRGSRFCGKACSNASFAARKQAADPRYFAAKQQRYRERRVERPAKKGNGGAFVYMD